MNLMYNDFHNLTTVEENSIIEEARRIVKRKKRKKKKKEYISDRIEKAANETKNNFKPIIPRSMTSPILTNQSPTVGQRQLINPEIVQLGPARIGPARIGPARIGSAGLGAAGAGAAGAGAGAADAEAAGTRTTSLGAGLVAAGIATGLGAVGTYNYNNPETIVNAYNAAKDQAFNLYGNIEDQIQNL